MNFTHHCNMDQSLERTGLCKQYHHHSLKCTRIEFLRIYWCKRGSNLELLIQIHICLRKTDLVTYKHSISGSKSAGKHVTKVRIGIKSENLIFKNLIWGKAILLERYMWYSHGPPCRNALFSLQNSVIIRITKFWTSITLSKLHNMHLKRVKIDMRFKNSPAKKAPYTVYDILYMIYS